MAAYNEKQKEAQARYDNTGYAAAAYLDRNSKTANQLGLGKSYRQVSGTNIRDLDYYAKQFGLDTSIANLQSKFDALTKAEYAQKRAEYARSEDEYYRNQMGYNQQYMTAANNAISSAIASGASRGMQFANQFAAQNQIASDNATGARDLAQAYNDLATSEAEAYTQNAINAYENIQQLKQNILTQAVADRANEVQRYAADVSYAAQDDTNRVNVYNNNQGLYAQLANKFLELAGQNYGNDMNYVNTRYNADKNYESQKYVADTSAAAQRYAANASAAAQRYAANRSYSTGSNKTYGGNTANAQYTTAEASDILDTYKKLIGSKDSKGIAERKFLENQYPWVVDAYKAYKKASTKTHKASNANSVSAPVQTSILQPKSQMTIEDWIEAANRQAANKK